MPAPFDSCSDQQLTTQFAQAGPVTPMADNSSPSSSDVEAHYVPRGNGDKSGVFRDSEVLVDGAETYLRDDIAIDAKLERKIMSVSPIFA